MYFCYWYKYTPVYIYIYIYSAYVFSGNKIHDLGFVWWRKNNLVNHKYDMQGQICKKHKSQKVTIIMLIS